jgi:hypothetical protein
MKDGRDDDVAERRGDSHRQRGQGYDHSDLRQRRHRGVQTSAGAGGFLGGMVRAMQATGPGAGKGGPRLQGQGEARQDGYRQASRDSRAARYPVDSRGVRLRQRPAS